ncbi:uncharacterized protein EAF01_009172 [Botrytis porri]|uniref:2EXR domain-containing protein n=1 Tax=Botrytis porri TaxID=87229 RepID=A0A4Z1KPG2_9HELO|nr:uncharacterized protein EAF01_009172 [Botrytis porri]KAF7896769.1 hypothetical protein EAF01_009172 [Botrytis porri]TGO87368.1 hypothetical protein BPOR_0231g00110 [Botrytis porri]
MIFQKSSDLNGSGKGQRVKRRRLISSEDSVATKRTTKKIKRIMPSNSASEATQPLTEFLLFEKLPQEIRRMIWNLTFQKDVAVEVKKNGGLYPMKNVFETPRIPALLVNREAREEAQSHMRKTVMFGSFPFNKQSDTLHLFFPLQFWACWLDFGESSPLSSLKVKHIVLNGFFFRRFLGIDNSSIDQLERRTQHFFTILSKMPELKTISVPTTGKDISSRHKNGNQTETEAQKMTNFDLIAKTYWKMAQEFQEKDCPEWKIPSLIYLDDQSNKPNHFSADEY